MAVTISICIPDEVHKQYEMLAQATGRMPNDLMVEALCAMVVWQLREIALIQEGVSQSHARLGIPIKDVIAEFKARGMLPAGFELGVGVDAPGS